EIGSHAKHMRGDLLRQVDRWGRQCPVRLIAAALQFLGAGEVARASEVCASWQLPVSVSNRLWEPLYKLRWEPDTASQPQIAREGEETNWKQRYVARK